MVYIWGGSGKTSLTLEFCLNRNHIFAADDMAVISPKGYLYPNLAYPKIYAYNLVNNKELERRVFKNTGLTNRLAWRIHKTLRRGGKVRRRLSPLAAFGNYIEAAQRIKAYFVLANEKREEVFCEKTNPQVAADLSRSLLLAEQEIFNRHILWHEFNCEVMGEKPLVRLEEICKRGKDVYLDLFNKIDTYLIRVPAYLSHQAKIQKVAEIIEERTK